MVSADVIGGIVNRTMDDAKMMRHIAEVEFFVF